MLVFTTRKWFMIKFIITYLVGTRYAPTGVGNISTVSLFIVHIFDWGRSNTLIISIGSTLSGRMVVGFEF